jgi:hypothetical protein
LQWRESNLDIDALYAGFCSTLPAELRAIAQELPFRLGLCPLRDVPWSSVFSHQVTLAAPVLVGEALPQSGRAAIRQATLSHLLAVIHAFTVDRLVDGQTAAAADLEALAGKLAHGRDAALAALIGPRAVDAYRSAENVMRLAIAEEHNVLDEGGPVSLERYLDVALGKQRVGFVASVALTEQAVGIELAELVERLLAAAALGLKLEDDVVDWQEDFARRGAWALCLARGLRTGVPMKDRSTEPNPIVSLVHRSGVLACMMHASARQMTLSSQLASRIGARRLAAWAEERASRAAQLAIREEKSPGFTLRARRLAPWAAEVLR